MQWGEHMRIAYLILAHANPTHLVRLVRALRSQDVDLYVHVDKKTRMRDFGDLASEGATLLRNRVPVYWGEYSMVEATLRLMSASTRRRPSYDYFVLISGADYPIRSNAHIHRFLSDRCGYEFINLVRMPSEKADKPMSRLTTFRGRSDRPTQNHLRSIGLRASVRLGLRWASVRDYRPVFGTMGPFAGSSWWALTRGAIEYVLEFVARHRRLVRYFESTLNPDEMFFQTILGNSPFREKIRRNITYTDWPAIGRGPAVISERHLPLFEGSARVVVKDVYGEGEVLFARKFTDECAHVVERIDIIRG